MEIVQFDIPGNQSRTVEHAMSQASYQENVFNNKLLGCSQNLKKDYFSAKTYWVISKPIFIINGCNTEFCEQN